MWDCKANVTSIGLLLCISMQGWQKIGPCMNSFWISQPDYNVPQLKRFCHSCQGYLNMPDFHSFPQGNPDTFVTSQIKQWPCCFANFTNGRSSLPTSTESLTEGAERSAEIWTAARIVKLLERSLELRDFKHCIIQFLGLAKEFSE